jgi:hypothetical protein
MFYYFILQCPYIFIRNYDNLIPSIFQPFRYVFIILTGLINFFITNFGKNKNYYLNSNYNSIYNDLENDSIYIISDLYTFFSLTYLFDFLFIQENKISSLLKEIENACKINKIEIDKNLELLSKSYIDKEKEFSLENSLWIIIFLFGIFLQFTGLRFHKYILFYLSYYYFVMILWVFGRVFKPIYLKLVYSILISIWVIFNFLIKLKTDMKLFKVIIKLFYYQIKIIFTLYKNNFILFYFVYNYLIISN